MKMTFMKSFLICTFKDPKFAEKWSNLAENQKKKFNSVEFMEFVFSKSVREVAWFFSNFFLSSNLTDMVKIRISQFSGKNNVCPNTSLTLCYFCKHYISPSMIEVVEKETLNKSFEIYPFAWQLSADVLMQWFSDVGRPDVTGKSDLGWERTTVDTIHY